MKDMVGLILQKMEKNSDFEKLKFLYKNIQENSKYFSFKRRIYDCIKNYIKTGSHDILILPRPEYCKDSGYTECPDNFFKKFSSKCGLKLLKKNNYERNEKCEYLVLSDEFLLCFDIKYKREINYLMEELHLKFIIENNTHNTRLYLSWEHWEDL